MAHPADPAHGARDDACPFTIRRPVMVQRWRDVTFAHWSVDVDAVRAILPPGLEPDTFDGRAWVSLVGFEMDALRIPHLPPIPTTHRFLEFNVRTYVVGPDGPGVWFCSLDVPNWLPVLAARVGFALPYDKGAVAVDRWDDVTEWRVERTWPETTTARLTVRSTGASVDPATDGLATFLTARWRLYSITRGGFLLTAAVQHEPWSLEIGELLEADTGVATVAGLPVSGDPIVHLASDVSVRVGPPRLRRVGSVDSSTLTVHFDDDCGFCSSSVRLLQRWSDDSVHYEPARNLADPALATLSEVAIIVTGESSDGVGTVASGVDGIIAVLRHSGPIGRTAAVLLGLPGVHLLADVVYARIAANRQRISRMLGLKAACELPGARTGQT